MALEDTKALMEEIPEVDLQLSDQTQTIQSGYDKMDQVSAEAQTALGEVEAAPAPTYQPVDTQTLQDDAGIKQGASYITPEATVAGQMDKLLNQESAYMQTAERRAQERAASLGLGGSSMAVGAAHRAAIESARPIAEADAKTYAATALAEQKVYNEISSKKAESDLSGAAREHMYDIDVAKAQTSAAINQIAESFKMKGNIAAEATMTQMKSKWDAETQAAIKSMEAKVNMLAQEQQISAQERQYASQQASQIMAASYGTINDLMGNADFMAGYADKPEKLTDVFNNFINLAKNQVEFIGATAGLADEYFAPDGYASLIGSWTTNMSGYVAPQ